MIHTSNMIRFSYFAETARALYSTGAHIFCGVRDTEKGEEVARDIAGDEVHERIHVIKLDLNSLDSVRKAVQTFLGKSQKLNILINNAGETWTYLLNKAG